MGVGTQGTERFVVGLEAVGPGAAAQVGGKGAGLAELLRIEGVRVPPGFCVTTGAFRLAVARAGARGRATAGAPAVPPEVAASITAAVERRGARERWAVRSSATAEDLPTASFAGQHDSFLDVVGAAAVVEHVGRCWASLSGEQAVAYRRRQGIDDRDVEMAVVVQRMVDPYAAGVLFTADPVSGHRGITSVESVRGLGDALVAGRVRPDVHTVRDDRIQSCTPAAGTPVLRDEQVLRLARIGRRVQAHAGRPQDVEWCLTEDDEIALVQARPITTLFPVPGGDDDGFRVLVSVGHQQMMTDPMPALGLSLFRMTALPRMHEAGGRLFVDVTDRLRDPATREPLLEAMGRSDPLIGDALRTVVARGDLGPATPGPPADGAAPSAAPEEPVGADPALVPQLVARSEAEVATLRGRLDATTGPAVFDVIRADVEELKRLLFDPDNSRVILVGMEAAWWLNDRLEEWLGERNAADTLSRSVPDNITAEMGLALLDVADAVRPSPEVVAFLEDVQDDDFLRTLPDVRGGSAAHDAIAGFLDRFGVRCVGEIDVTRPRWSERPSALVPLILGNVRSFAPRAGAHRFEEGRLDAWEREQELLARLRELPDGEEKATQTGRMIDRVRTFSGYREYPKYGIVSRYAAYRGALLAEADRLVDLGVLETREDCFHLTFEEFEEAARTGAADLGLVARRRRDLEAFRALTPPRVLTSDGETVAGHYRREDLPPGALAGLAVSGGTVEGRARVIHDLGAATVEPGDILVTTFTDPSWTPLLVGVAGLVTEVGGLMTHGAVIAREYGLPAVVGVPGATGLIEDGRRIRVHGSDGVVELLPQDGG